MTIFSLTYVSTAHGLYEKSIYRDIALLSHAYNKDNHITGMLLVYNDSITQFLEGPEKSVRDLYARIEKDSRHKAPMVVPTRNLEKREFPMWTMGYQEVTEKLDPKFIFTLDQESLGNYVPPDISGTSKAIVDSFSKTSGLVAI